MARSLKNSRVPAQRPAAPHRDQPRGVERIDHQDHDRQIQERQPQRQRGGVEGRQPVQRAVIAPAPAGGAAAGRTDQRHHQQHSSTTAAAEATGQSLLVKNSSHKVWPIISESGTRQQIGDHEFADDRDEAQQHAGGHARQRQRKRHQPERLPRRAPRSAAASSSAGSSLGERRVERQDHERQIGIDDAEIHRAVGGEPHHRRGYQMQRQQDLVEQAVMLQDVDPGIDADQERGPERQRSRASSPPPASAAAAAPCHRRSG